MVKTIAEKATVKREALILLIKLLIVAAFIGMMLSVPFSNIVTSTGTDKTESYKSELHLPQAGQIP